MFAHISIGFIRKPQLSNEFIDESETRVNKLHLSDRRNRKQTWVLMNLKPGIDVGFLYEN